MNKTVEPEFAPNFEDVSEATWDALRRCATDNEVMERLLDAMAVAGRFEQWIAGPAVADALVHEPLADGLDAHERADLAGLLAAMINARFEVWAIEKMGAHVDGDRLVW